MLNGQPIIDLRPGLVMDAGDVSRMIVSSEAMKAVETYLLAYANAASKRLHAIGKVNCEDFHNDVRYLLGAEEAAIDIARNLHQELKRKGATQ